MTMLRSPYRRIARRACRARRWRLRISSATSLLLARSVSSLRRNHTSEVGREADTPRQLNRNYLS